MDPFLQAVTFRVSSAKCGQAQSLLKAVEIGPDLEFPSQK